MTKELYVVSTIRNQQGELVKTLEDVAMAEKVGSVNVGLDLPLNQIWRSANQNRNQADIICIHMSQI